MSEARFLGLGGSDVAYSALAIPRLHHHPLALNGGCGDGVTHVEQLSQEERDRRD